MDVLDMDDDLLELGSGDMRDMWDTASLLETSLTEGDGEWTSYEDPSSSVILRDRMITEASLPIKSEHSYCNDVVEPALAPVKLEDDMESECYPAISMSAATSGGPGGGGAPERAAPSSPLPGQVAPRQLVLTQPPREPLQLVRAERAAGAGTAAGQTGHTKVSTGQSMLRPQTIVLTTSRPPLLSRSSDSSAGPRLNVKLEPSAAFLLPPTPPSSSDSEGGSSPPHAGSRLSPVRSVLQRTPKVLVTAGRPAVRHLNASLISTTPRGAHGTLYLTEEEKRTLVSEGYAIPSRLPLSKAEERSLKKIRRKIKNKISAQESRRKKKEYMDLMERRLDQMAADNDEYRQRLAELEAQRCQLDADNVRLEARNAELSRQLEQLRRAVGSDCSTMKNEASVEEISK